MINEIILGQLVSEAFNGVKRLLKTKGVELVVSKDALEDTIRDHINYIQNKISFITFRELRGNRLLSDLYIEIDIELQRRRYRDYSRKYEKFIIEQLVNRKIKLDDKPHIVLLGGPGAGKTTTVQNVCRRLLDTQFKNKYSFPILIYLRDLQADETVYSRLKNNLGIEFFFKHPTKHEHLDSSSSQMLFQNLINSFLNSLNVVIILDGLDEVEPSRLSSFHSEIDYLMSNLHNSLVILTCRSASLDFNFSYSEEFELCDLNDNQVDFFVLKWFSNKVKSENFLSEIRSSQYYDLSLKPLTLAHLCAIYEKTDRLYDKPRFIYRKLIDLLIEEWDEQRRIKDREKYFERNERDSVYSNFNTQEKSRFLREFAYDLIVNNRLRVYTQDDFHESYLRIYDNHNLPKYQAKKVIQEIEAHNGIIVLSGYDRFVFYHKSMQENMAAEYMIKMDSLPYKFIGSDKINISNEYAIAICLSSDHNKTFYRFIFEELVKYKFDSKFIVEFLDRLYLERPIFKISILFPLSLILIYTILTNNGFITSRKGKVSDFDTKFSDRIVAFRMNHFINDSFKLFNQFFSIKWEYRTDSLYRLIMSEEIFKYSQDTEAEYLENMPNLYIPEALFNGCFSNKF